MSQAIMSRRLTVASLRRTPDPRTVLIRMAVDEARRARIRTLKAKHPEITWRQIADAVGVQERSAIQWQATGALKKENARALAQVWDVDFGWLWDGPKADTPDLMAAVASNGTPASQLDRIEAKLDETLGLLSQLVDPEEDAARTAEEEGPPLDSPPGEFDEDDPRSQPGDRAG